MIKAIAVDDELHCLNTLEILVNEYCPDIKLVDQCGSVKDALVSIEKNKPDLVFLDIEMPVSNGFDLLNQFEIIPFAVIFTTSYNQYAIKAIHFSALDYLLKPIDPEELIKAVHKIEGKKQFPSHEQLMMILDHMQQKSKTFSKIAVPTAEGFELIPADLLLRCEAENNYTHLFLKDKRKLTACRTLKEMEEQLQEFSFFIRVHHSYLVNLNEINKYIRGEGGYLVMSDGATISVSRSRKEALLKVFDRNS
jgi:two-component system LytT family response regulator